jgi:hypothetical protein
MSEPTKAELVETIRRTIERAIARKQNCIFDPATCECVDAMESRNAVKALAALDQLAAQKPEPGTVIAKMPNGDWSDGWGNLWRKIEPGEGGQGEADRGPFDMPILTYKPDEPWQKGHIYMLRGDELIEHDARTSESTADARGLVDRLDDIHDKYIDDERKWLSFDHIEAYTAEAAAEIERFVASRLARPEPPSGEPDDDAWMQRAKEYAENGGCPVCFATDEDGHTSDCEWGQAEARAEKAESELQKWNAAADQSRQPPAFYWQYSEATMRAMQALLSKAEGEVKALREALVAAELPLSLFVIQHPKWTPLNGVEQDPAGSHKALEMLRAALVKGEVERK